MCEMNICLTPAPPFSVRVKICRIPLDEYPALFDSQITLSSDDTSGHVGGAFAIESCGPKEIRCFPRSSACVSQQEPAADSTEQKNKNLKKIRHFANSLIHFN